MDKEIKKIEDQLLKKSIVSKPWFKSLVGIIIIILALFAFIYWRTVAGKVIIENSSIEAPIINLSSSTPGILSDIYVNVGDIISDNTPIAKVGNEIIVSKVKGIIVSVNHQEGQFFGAGSPVVSMINTKEERVLGKIDEDKGLVDIKVGQPATFTVDAFGNKKFNGVVSEISPMSNESGVIFNISDKREIKKFDVKVSFDENEYPMLRQGMSAKITVFVR
jgi:multidrug resistance efflux pump